MCTVSTTGLNEAWLPFIGEERNVPRDRKYNSNVATVEQLANSNYFLSLDQKFHSNLPRQLEFPANSNYFSFPLRVRVTRVLLANYLLESF